MRFDSLPTIFGLMLAMMAPARGDSPSPAKIHFDRGFAAYALRNFSEAAEEYEIAFKLKPEPALLYNAAQSHRLAGNKKRALSLYESYLRMFDRPQRRAEVNHFIADLRAAIAADERSAIAPPNDLVKSDPVVEPPVAATPLVIREPDKPPVVVQPTLVSHPTKPLARRGWFWGVMGTTAAVVIGGVVVGVVLGTSTSRYPQPAAGTASLN